MKKFWAFIIIAAFVISVVFFIFLLSLGSVPHRIYPPPSIETHCECKPADFNAPGIGIPYSFMLPDGRGMLHNCSFMMEAYDKPYGTTGYDKNVVAFELPITDDPNDLCPYLHKGKVYVDEEELIHKAEFYVDEEGLTIECICGLYDPAPN